MPEIRDVLPSRALESLIVGARLAAVPAWKVDPLDAAVGERLHNVPGVVGARVADDQQLEVPKRLRERRADS